MIESLDLAAFCFIKSARAEDSGRYRVYLADTSHHPSATLAGKDTVKETVSLIAQ